MITKTKLILLRDIRKYFIKGLGTVKHKDLQINNGLHMTVTTTYGAKAYCEWYKDGIKGEYFAMKDLELVSKGQEILGMRMMPK